MVGNNGSAFGGLNGNTMWFNTSGAVAMMLGRFFMHIPVLAIAGNLAKKKIAPASAGTFPVTGGLFTALLVSPILFVSALTFFQPLSLDPIPHPLHILPAQLSLPPPTRPTPHLTHSP